MDCGLLWILHSDHARSLKVKIHLIKDGIYLLARWRAGWHTHICFTWFPAQEVWLVNMWCLWKGLCWRGYNIPFMIYKPSANSELDVCIFCSRCHDGTPGGTDHRREAASASPGRTWSGQGQQKDEIFPTSLCSASSSAPPVLLGSFSPPCFPLSSLSSNVGGTGSCHTDSAPWSLQARYCLAGTGSRVSRLKTQVVPSFSNRDILSR